jgi:hypothetical protein
MKMTKVISKGKAGHTLEIGPIDIDILKKQHEQLVEMIWNDTDNILWGIVYMLEDVIDEIEG